MIYRLMILCSLFVAPAAFADCGLYLNPQTGQYEYRCVAGTPLTQPGCQVVVDARTGQPVLLCK